MKGQMYFSRVLLLLCLFITPGILTNAQQITVNCPVFQQDYATGTCNATAKTQASIIKAIGGIGGQRGWAKFNISNIPDNAIITSLKLHYYISSQYFPYYMITKLAADPVMTAAPNIFALIGEANPNWDDPLNYFQYEGSPVNGWNAHSLNLFANSDLQNSLNQNWFAVGFYEYDYTSNYYLYADGWDQTNEPYLEVKYTQSNLNNDLGLTAITSPETHFCPGSHPVKAVIHNSGLNAVNNAHISWSINNVSQPVYFYNNTAGLPSGSLDTVTLGNYNFSQTDSTVLAIITQVNGTVDPFPANDTIFKYFHLNNGATFSQPVNQTVIVGSNTSFTVWIYYWANQTFHWQVSSDGGQTFTDLVNNSIYSNVDSFNLQLHSVPLSLDGYRYRCRVGTVCGTLYSNNALLTVLQNNLAITNIYASNDTLCANSTTLLHATVSGGTGNYTFSWTSDPPGFTSNLQNPTVMVTQNTLFLLTVNDGVNTVTATVWVYFMQLPLAPGNIGGPSSVCKGPASVLYSVDPIPGALYYSWTLPNGVTGSSNTNHISVVFTSTAVSGNITVKGYNYCGAGPISIKPILVNQSPVANAGPDQTIYAGATATLTASATGGTPPYSFAWSNGMTGVSITVTPTATTTYIVTVTDFNGCTGVDYAVIHVNNVTSLVTYCPNLNLCPGNILVPIYVHYFYGVASISLSLHYDTTHLTFTGYQDVNTNLSSGTMLVNSSGDYVQVAWFSITPANIGNGLLLNLKFQADTGYSALSWDLVTQGACQYTNLNNANIPALFYNGSVTVQPCSNVEGFVWYDNNNHTPMSTTPVILSQSGVTVYQTMTDSTGHYSFSNLANGTYQSSVQPSKPWGGVNAADALQILKHFVNMLTITGMAAHAADVDMSSAINGVDALLVAKRFVHMINSFPASDWLYDGNTFTMNGSANVYDSIIVICAGDADRSYYPPLAKIAPSVQINCDNSVLVAADENIEIPFYVGSNVDVGSISMVMDFTSDYLTLTDVKAVKDGYQLYTYDGRQIWYAWYSIEPMALKAGDEIFRLICRPGKNTGDLMMAADQQFEITDVHGITIQDLDLTYSKPVMTENTAFLGQNVPNPFDSYTDIPYTLSESGHIQLIIYDNTGKMIDQLIDKQQDKGSYSIRFNPNGLAPGLYICRMTVATDSSVTSFSKRLMIK